MNIMRQVAANYGKRADHRAGGDYQVMKKPWNTHKHTRISQNWGVEYSYYERNRQLAKAHRMVEEHHRGRRRRK